MQPYAADQFTATSHATAADKAAALDALVRFIGGGYRRTLFTQRVYHTLSRQLLGHIAHFSREGFYAVWFSTPERQLDWLVYAEAGGEYGLLPDGDPACTWSDVERQLRTFIRDRRLIPAAQAVVDGRIEASERRELARLIEKYGAQA